MRAIKLPAAVIIMMLLGSYLVFAQTGTSTNADAAWQKLQNAANLPQMPQVENGKALTDDQILQYYGQVVNAATAAAAKARAFYTQFPDSSNAVPAKLLECHMLQTAFYDSVDEDTKQSAFTNMAKVQDALLADSRLTDTQRFDVRVQIAQRVVQDPQLDPQAAAAAYEKNLRQLIKDYPNKDTGYDLLLTFAAESYSDDQARSIAKEVLADPVSDSVKAKANAILRRLNAVGKPLDIKFTALDGRAVNLSQMKGKVVLVDFWATWCGPCVGEIPGVKEVYQEFHTKGFDVIGISFDSSAQALKSFVAGHDMPWPEYFDGKVWQNKFCVQYAIDSIPTLWLVDKNGNLADSNAGEDLQGKVETLLAK